jgi:hypothetical protein
MNATTTTANSEFPHAPKTALTRAHAHLEAA